MSLEQSIEKLAEAIRYHADAKYGLNLQENLIQTTIKSLVEQDIASLEVNEDAKATKKNKKEKNESILENTPEFKQETKVKNVTYKEVRELILKLLSTHAKEIKEINKSHGINRPSELLTDPEDFDSKIKDQNKLNDIYADLLKLGE